MSTTSRLGRGIAATLLTAVLALGGATAAHAAPAAPVAADDADCLARGQAMIEQYRTDAGLAADSTVYVACTNDVPTVWSVDAAGTELAPTSDFSTVEPVTTNGEVSLAAPVEPQAVEGFSCAIGGVYVVECEWGTTYQKYSGSTLVWERHISAYARLNLQITAHGVFQRYTNDSGVSMDVEGQLILQRQQGITPPTFENSTDFYYDGGTQPSGTDYVSRTTTDEGKYSIIFNLTYVEDHSEGIGIPIIGDPTSPRFQCYAASTGNNCEYPNGQEAGVF